jgi:hypothetical protein
MIQINKDSALTLDQNPYQNSQTIVVNKPSHQLADDTRPPKLSIMTIREEEAADSLPSPGTKRATQS